jgi:hypothetical protein
MNNTSHPAFEKLLEGFLQLAGQDPAGAKGSNGFEFESGDHTARVFPDADGAHVVIEVDVRSFGPHEMENASLLLMLHRLNESALPQHGWIATIDEVDELVLSTMLRIHETDGLKLQASVTDALDRAESLTALVSQFTNSPSESGAVAQKPLTGETVHEQGTFNPLDRA